MSRDYAPNHSIWKLTAGALEDLDEHLPKPYEVVEVKSFERFAKSIIVERDGERRRFVLRLTESR